MSARFPTRAAAFLGAAMVVGVAVTAPALAATKTHKDPKGDVSVYAANPHNKFVDINKVTINASKKTVTVSMHIKDLRKSTTDETQLLQSSIVPSSTKDAPDDPKRWAKFNVNQYEWDQGLIDCQLTLITENGKKSEDVTVNKSCVTNTTKDTVKFTMPMKQLGSDPKYVHVMTSAMAMVWDAEHETMSGTGSDHAFNVEKVG